MVSPTTLVLLVRTFVISPILYMVYKSFLCDGLNPSISGMARDTITVITYGI